MPVPVSSLSVAVQGIADFLHGQFGEDVNITVAHPMRASEIAKGAGATAHCLNLFAYRVAPSGFHADAGPGDTQFVRINVLLTPFPADLDNAADDADIRILGHAIRVLQSHPVLPVPAAPPLPGAAISEPPGRKAYRLEAVMLAPPMEEINHIWTTQGGDLAYRLSAAYEFSLIPIEPLTPGEPALPPRTLILDALAGTSGDRSGFAPLGSESRAIPLAGAAGPPAVRWAPVQMFVQGDALTNVLEIAADAAEATLAVAGPAGGEAAMQVVWITAAGAETAQPIQVELIGSARLDAPEARLTLQLAAPAGAIEGTVRTRPAAGGAPVPGAAFGNALTLTVA